MVRERRDLALANQRHQEWRQLNRQQRHPIEGGVCQRAPVRRRELRVHVLQLDAITRRVGERRGVRHRVGCAPCSVATRCSDPARNTTRTQQHAQLRRRSAPDTRGPRVVQGQQSAQHVTRRKSDAVETKLRPNHWGAKITLGGQRKQQGTPRQTRLQHKTQRGPRTRLARWKCRASDEHAPRAIHKVQQHKQTETLVHVKRIVMGEQMSHG